MDIESKQPVKINEQNFDEDDDDFEEFDVEDWEKEKNQEQIGIKQWYELFTIGRRIGMTKTSILTSPTN
jgi:hypothetical protein